MAVGASRLLNSSNDAGNHVLCRMIGHIKYLAKRAKKIERSAVMLHVCVVQVLSLRKRVGFATKAGKWVGFGVAGRGSGDGGRQSLRDQRHHVMRKSRGNICARERYLASC